ncbi:transposase [Desulfomicrobium orale DSM 12838]|uniref:Transposase n=1 Tax=Desulfomicrobium orale DSM 12838 TaxID=888061 RepID=A0A0X8JRJ2_9BACT|nr:transposase [Desulfomicrobium orale DSM 12838]AMD91990.1 transposase [Desulfomicrobium orale DSM 12838]AMD92051.1 transposase [Desulfomicrobium orale DSM 12838]AMD92095.1 transposase [Desulfomicrobium orale DSM 12838]AMD92714.1 transposase [Desulfomicrobium orale DSM 12838]
MSHHNTLFSQTLSLIPRHVFQKLERRHKTGRSSRQFGFKEQFTVMAFIQLAARRSMRDGLRCLEAAGNRLYHWGLKNVARSTFADANNSRPVGFFKDLFAEMYGLCAAKAPKHKFRFKSKLFSLDATTIKLCLSLFPWASFRQAKGGVKVHTLLDHDGHIPAFATVTDAKTHESRIAQAMELPRGSIVVFDKGFISYPWFRILGAKGVFFVTRLKRNAVFKLLERRLVNRKTGVTSDHIIEVSSRGKSLRLRRIGYRDQETGKHYEFLTNHFRLSAKTIADIYKDRWQIELFFKEIKQNLRIKTFVGNSENAVLIQIYTALTVYLLLAYQKFLSRLGLSVQQLFQLIQLNLLGEASLDELLNPRRRKFDNSYNFKLLDYIA